MKKIIVLVSLVFTVFISNAQCVSTVAGSGTDPYFTSPYGVAVDGSGNVYVSDYSNQRIRKISASGVVTILAGSGTSGFADGTGDSAQFHGPYGVAVDGSGNVYVADSFNNRIRKITPSGVVTTLAGSGTEGYVDGTGTSAQFYQPRGVAVDGSGNVYVGDTYNHRIRKITPSGFVTTLAGTGTTGFLDGTSTSAQFNNPRGVAVDGSGNVYVADTENNSIRKISASGVVTTLAGSGTAGYAEGTGTSAQFDYPWGVAVDGSGNIYVGDARNYRVRKITPSGVVTTLAGSATYGYADGTGTSAQFSGPFGVAVDASGNFYIADTGNQRIRKITAAGVVTTLVGSGTPGYTDGAGTSVKFNSPSGVAVDGIGNVYVADTFNQRIRKITVAGVVTTFAGSGTQGYADGTGTAAKFNNPSGVAVDASGNVYVADYSNHRIRKITPSGVVTTLAGSGTQGYADGTSSSAQFNNPRGIAVDGSGNVYIADRTNQRIRKITPSGVVTTLAGSGTQGYADGNGASTQFNNPSAVAVDGSSNVYVADTDNHRIRKITVAGVVTTIAGLGVAGFYDGAGTGSQFNYPRGVAVDGSGNVYVGDTNNNRIRKISPSGFVTTLAGSGILGYAEGTDTSARFSFPEGVAVHGSGNVYVADYGNHIIRKVIATTTSISADGIIATDTTITNGSAVQLQLNGTLNTQPNIQWTPATAISSATIADPVVYPSATTTYTASFINSNGCTQTTSFTVNVTPQPNIGNLSITSSNATIGLFDTITVNVQLTNASDLYSLYMKLKGNAAVSQYLDYTGYTAGTLLGVSNVISTPPTVTNGVPDFGMTKIGSVPGYAGSGLFYTFTFVPKNNIVIPTGTTFCFYLDDVSAYNATGIPCGLTNQGQYCYTFTNQLNVWPGDLNNSKTVTTADLLPIGYFYNSTGTARPNATIQWTPQPATLWGYNRTNQNSDAYKVFADSNGNGVVNNADQAAIGFNMNKIHAKTGSSAPWPAPPHFTAQQLAAAVGTLTVTANNTIINGAFLPQSVTFTVNINNTGGLGSLYGISVNLLFDETIFDLNTATVDYTGSIFGVAGTDCLALNYNSTNMVSVGLTRYANAAINGQGLLFKVTIQTKSTLPNLPLTPVTAYVDAANNQAGDTLVIQDAPTTNLTIINNLGIDIINQDDFVLYPNPTSDKIYIIMGSTATQTNELKVKVFNILGQNIEEQPIQNTTTELSTKNWGVAGVYFLQITNSNNTTSVTKKVIVNGKL